MDGNGVTSFSPGGRGHVDCVFAPEALTGFFIVENQDGTVNIESVAFPGVFLRMDGRGVTSWTWGGAGSVNCQFGAGPWETFLLKPLDQLSEGPPALGFFNIESVAFPNVYLRIDGIPGAFNSPGTVNCQFTPGAWEQLSLDLVDPQPEGVPVPDVLNDSPDEARALIEAAGFRFSSIGIPVKGTLTPFVESQNPPGGLLALVGITVGVTIAEPVMGIVPDVLNESPSSASSKNRGSRFPILRISRSG